MISINYENRKYEEEYRKNYIYREFLLQFFNSFGFLFFLALFRPMSNMGGQVSCGSQGSGSTCLQELVLFVFLIFVLQQIIDLGLRSLNHLIYRLRARQAQKKIATELNLYNRQYSISAESLELEVGKKILQFGYIILLALAFPLGPIVAVINNFFESRLDVSRLVHQYRKPFVRKYNGISGWNQVLSFLIYFSVLVNSLSYPFIADGFYELATFVGQRNYTASNMQYQQLGFFILYTFISFLIGVAIHFWISNVPKQVLIGIASEQFIQEKRSEEDYL